MNLEKNIVKMPGGVSIGTTASGSALNFVAGQGKILVVADDFTGSNDTGVQFAKRKLRSIVIMDKDKISKSLSDCDVLVVDTESRFDTRDKAYNKTYLIGIIVKTENIKCFYKKLDSTFRGNIGAEIAGLMDSLEIQHAVIVPAFPSNQRLTRNGMVYVKGELLADTETANDPRTPVTESFIPDILSRQTDKSTGLINFSDVHAGRERLIRILQQHIDNKIQLIVIDALSDEDLDLIASVTTSMKDRILFAGSPGLAQYLPKYLDSGNRKKSSVVIAGSVSDITRRQIDFAKESLAITVIDVETGKLFTGEEHQEKKRIMDIVSESSQKGEDIIIRSAQSREVVSGSFELGQKRGLSRSDVSEIVAHFLGDIAANIIKEIKINGILLTGGDTAIKTLQSLNISGTIIQDEIQAGIPYGHFIENQYSDIIVVTKAGGFGGEDAILQVLSFLTERQKR